MCIAVLLIQRPLESAPKLASEQTQILAYVIAKIFAFRLSYLAVECFPEKADVGCVLPCSALAPFQDSEVL